MRKGLTLGLALTLLALPASGQVQEPEALVITAENVTASEAERTGSEQGVSVPGDLIEYRLAFTNITDGAVSRVVLNDPIPAGLVFVPGSVTASREDVVVDYSIDGGASWSEQPVVEVEVDGQTVLRPAPAEAFTHVRWTVAGEVNPGAQLFARFRARVVGRANAGGDA